MKLCQIMAGNEEGGLENHFVQLCNGLLLSQSNIELTVIAHPKYADRFHSKIHFLPLDLTKGRRNPLTLFRLARLLRQNPMDIIHAHANKATSMLATISNFVSGRKIATIHSQKKNNKMFEKMDWVIGVSKSVLKEIGNKNKSVIYNGVPKIFSMDKKHVLVRSELGINNDLPIALSVGRLVPVKGVDVLVNAWRDLPANLLVIGDGGEKQALQKIVADNKDIQNVFIMGVREDISALMDLADLTIISSYREGFSYVVAESLLTGTPVISTDVPVANEILPEKYIVAAGNSEALRGLIKGTLQQLDLLNDDSKELFQFAKNEFTEDSMIRKISTVYQNIT